jgi:uncharacterized protein (UPF0264 family)
MTGMLASVNSIKEATLALDAQVDIIDLKQPSLGALGALDHTLIRQIVKHIGGKCPVSATIGDLPMQPAIVVDAVSRLAPAGVDYIKIGFFPGGDWPGTIAGLGELTPQHRLIAVLFADTQPDINLIKVLADHGFTGVMLDTMNKQKGNLTTLMKNSQLRDFVLQAKAYLLICGLAGSLTKSDISELLRLAPDYLGFRGALCNQQLRTAALDREAVKDIRQAIFDPLYNQDLL